MKRLTNWTWPWNKVKFDRIKHQINFAFSCAGTDYYEFADPFNMPPQRGYNLLLEWSLMKAKVTDEYLQKHAEFSDSLLAKDHKNVFEAKTDFKKVNDQLKERLSYLAFDVENLYRVAAVHFFDKDENPEIFDRDHALQKIKHWKQHAKVSDFFFQQPMLKLFPFLEGQEENIQNFEEVVSRLNSFHLANLSVPTSGK